MPPKENKDATTTREAGTDPPDPIEFDPFDLDNSLLRSLFAPIFKETKEAASKLQAQNTSGAPLAIRNAVSSQLQRVIGWMEGFAASLEKTRTVSDRLQCIERDIREIKAVTKEIPPAKTWAQIAATNTISPTASTTKAVQATIRAKRRELHETLRKHRQPYEVTLTTAVNETKQTLTDMRACEITKRCQDIINAETTAKPTLNGINKITNGIRLQCKSPEDAQIVLTANWNSAFEGLAIHKPNYGIVVHGVAASELATLEMTTKAATLQEWGKANGGIKIKTIKTLRRKQRANRIPSAHQSIVILTDDPAAADRCIKLGFFIDSERHKAEKYAPQLHITQCYKCYEYGHRATHCKRKEKCGNCGAENHKTNDCEKENEEHTCCRCKGNHQAWSVQCPERDAESQRLMILRSETSPFFTS